MSKDYAWQLGIIVLILKYRTEVTMYDNRCLQHTNRMVIKHFGRAVIITFVQACKRVLGIKLYTRLLLIPSFYSWSGFIVMW